MEDIAAQFSSFGQHVGQFVRDDVDVASIGPPVPETQDFANQRSMWKQKLNELDQQPVMPQRRSHSRYPGPREQQQQTDEKSEFKDGDSVSIVPRQPTGANGDRESRFELRPSVSYSRESKSPPRGLRRSRTPPRSRERRSGLGLGSVSPRARRSPTPRSRRRSPAPSPRRARGRGRGSPSPSPPGGGGGGGGGGGRGRRGSRSRRGRRSRSPAPPYDDAISYMSDDMKRLVQRNAPVRELYMFIEKLAGTERIRWRKTHGISWLKISRLWNLDRMAPRYRKALSEAAVGEIALRDKFEQNFQYFLTGPAAQAISLSLTMIRNQSNVFTRDIPLFTLIEDVHLSAFFLNLVKARLQTTMDPKSWQGVSAEAIQTISDWETYSLVWFQNAQEFQDAAGESFWRIPEGLSVPPAAAEEAEEEGEAVV